MIKVKVIAPLKDAKYIINDGVSKKNKEIATVEEAKSFALEVIENWIEYFDEQLNGINNITKQNIDCLSTKYKEYLEDQVICKVVEMWDDKEEYDEYEEE